MAGYLLRLLVLAALPLSAAAAQAPPPAPAAVDSAAELRVRADLGRIRGAESAPVWVVAISDFECPFCKRWHDETAGRIETEYVRTGKVRIAYMNYPLSSHRNARPAHEAAMCAAEQGKFWPMADAIFASQDVWKKLADPRGHFDSAARAAGVDMTRQRACLSSGAVRPLIDADLERSTRAGAGSTPSFFIGSRALIGAQPYAAFKQAIDAALAAVPAKP
jgi:protein-disulfide isomerase